MSGLKSNQYGKAMVRVMKVLRGTQHEVCELEADVLLRGDLEGSYFGPDNSSIVPTDTVKNTVHALAYDALGTCRTSFAKVLGAHFLEHYVHLDGVSVELRERRWKRMNVENEGRAHSFVAEGNGEWFCRGEFARPGGEILRAGIRNHLIMKTTGSGFAGYAQCELTTLPPTNDRILSTRLTAEWTFSDQARDYGAADEAILKAAYEVFSGSFSPSVQRTLFQIGEAALAAVPGIDEIALTLPNVHFLGMDLTKLGRPGNDCLFLPTDEPHGQIEAVVTR
ncbi:MAG: urate oxidase [Verrucomicrobia bacterium]|jgi:urate oxidase|nr:urate oxidase [Verrucomicrobiota bacterium]MDA1203769.1 urate oxidase [Verrucomicrobiota bacterium]